MPTTSNFTSSGALQFTRKTAFVATSNTLSSNPFQNLLACYIVTDIRNKSFFLKVNGVVVAHFVNDNIVSWELNSSIITIKTKDEVAYTLTFVMVSEAMLADQRINDNMNNLVTTGC